MDEVTIDGTTMPMGSKVMGMIISANRDEAVFDRPDELDLGRDPNRHLTFAFGKHFCLGNQLARLEGQTAIDALLRRFPSMRLAVRRDQLQYKPVQSLRGFPCAPRDAALSSESSTLHPTITMVIVRPLPYTGDRSAVMSSIAPAIGSDGSDLDPDVDLATVSTEAIMKLAAASSARISP